MSAAVVYDQEVVWAKGFGYADVEKKVSATPQTIYRIASITKVFTATALMQLRDAGKVGLDDPLTKYIPSFRLASRFADSPPITLLQLATHASGFPREAPLDYWLTLKFPPVETMIEAVSTKGERAFPPYVESKYSNVGFAILGYALSQAAGQPYFSYVKQNILDPLGMQQTGFTLTPSMTAQMATGYFAAKDGKPPEPAYQPDYGGYGPASSLYTSVEDIAKFMSLQFRDGPAGGSQILRGSTLREMHTAHWVAPDWNSGWGIGFAMSRIGNHTSVGHGGGIQGFRTHIEMIPALKVGVAVFTNTNASPEVFTREMLQLLIPVIERAEARARPVPPPAPASWQQYVGVYVNPFGKARIRVHNNQLQLLSDDEADGGPVALTPVAEHKFRMQGGFSSGELLVFEVDAKGKVFRMWVGQFPMERE